MADTLSTAADYCSDMLAGMDFDVTCQMRWGDPSADVCSDVAVADVDFINGDGLPVEKFACGGCVDGMRRGGWLLGARYF